MSYSFRKLSRSVVGLPGEKPVNHIGLQVARVDGRQITSIDLCALFDAGLLADDWVRDLTDGMAVDGIVVQLSRDEDDSTIICIEDAVDFPHGKKVFSQVMDGGGEWIRNYSYARNSLIGKRLPDPKERP